MEALKWNREEVQFVLSGKLYFTPLTDYHATTKKGRTLKFMCASALLVTLGKPTDQYRPEFVSTDPTNKQLVLPKGKTGITDAALVLMKEKGNRFVLCRVSSSTSALTIRLHKQILTGTYSKRAFIH